MSRTVSDTVAPECAGQLEAAVAAYTEVLQSDPDNPEALHRLGLIAEHEGDPHLALALVEKAIRCDPSAPQYRYSRGLILHRLERLDEALASLDRAVHLKPDFAEAHLNRGASLQALARWNEALAACDEAIRIRPDYALAHSNRGAILSAQGKVEEALAAYDQALRLDPGCVWAHLGRATILQGQGRVVEALAAYDRALRLKPDWAEAHNNRSAALGALGRMSEAQAAAEEALRLDPEFAEAHHNRGVALEGQGWLSEALAAYDRAIRVDPASAEPHKNRGNALQAQGRFAEALAAYREALRLRPGHPGAYGNYLFCLSYDPAQDDIALAEAHREWGDRYGRSPDVFTAWDNPRDPDKVLRVGLLSADFGRHPVGYFLSPLLAASDPDQVHYIGYSGRVRDDDLTERLKGYLSGWRSTLGLSDRTLAETMRADGIDILIDLAGHTAGNRLGCVALKPAPVQVHWAGTSHSVPSVDYSFWDAIQVPEGDERWFVEKIVRLPGVHWCYGPPEYAPEVVDPPALANGQVTFGSFNNLIKVNPGVVALWARVLRETPGSRLVLSWRTLADPGQRERFQSAFAERGVAPDRLDLRVGAPTHAGVLGEYGEVDIALDPFPFTGCLTTFEALWMGVPVVTWPQTRPVSRQTEAILTTLGRTEWIARDEPDYVRIATALALDVARLTALRRTQRQRMAGSPLCDGPRFARNFEVALREIWRVWCASGD